MLFITFKDLVMLQKQRGSVCGWAVITRVRKNTWQFSVPVNSSVCLLTVK
jgi:hypothetical protein